MSSVWREEPWTDAAEEVDEAFAQLVGPLAASEDALALRSGSGEVALVASWPAVASGSNFEVRLDSEKASHHRVAFVSAGARQEARALLRYADLVGIPRGSEDRPVGTLEDLVSCGRITVKNADGSTGRIDLYAGAPVDLGRLMQGAPTAIEEPEDLDAREDWFKKRH